MRNMRVVAFVPDGELLVFDFSQGWSGVQACGARS
jgi:hypothetical protein